MTSVVLKAKRDFSVRRHHPWIFSGALQSGSGGAAALGETVEVVSADGEILGYGSCSPASQIRVRMLSFDAKQIPDAAFIGALVEKAIAKRKWLFDNGATNAVRLINAESDGLPGVVVDYYAGWAICQLTSAGAEFWRDEIVEALMQSDLLCNGVGERLDVDVRSKEGLPTEPAFRLLSGTEPPERIEIREGPCKFLVDVRGGHKTGFYLDQREARQLVGSLSRNAEVLNCFAYTGGFGLYARAGGAASVEQVDMSSDALAIAMENERLSSGGSTKMSYVEADVFKYLRKCRDEGRKFDLIVLDPPKFAATKGQLMKASRGYKDINLLAMKLLRPNGILATFSCSGAMSLEFFDQILSESALDAKRNFQIIARTRQGADHPVSLAFPEGAYLKGVILKE